MNKFFIRKEASVGDLFAKLRGNAAKAKPKTPYSELRQLARLRKIQHKMLQENPEYLRMSVDLFDPRVRYE
jgi:hypothetical protein